MESIFTKIFAGELPASFVYQDDVVSAFMDIQPVNAGHVLIVPLQFAARLEDLPPETGAHLFRVGQKIATALYASDLACEGVNFLLADGEVAGQDVFHVHLHVIPRFAGDGFGLKYAPSYADLPLREVLDRAAEAIRRELDQ